MTFPASAPPPSRRYERDRRAHSWTPDDCISTSIQHVADHAVGEFWFEPGGFRRHDFAGVRHCHQVGHLRGIERERYSHLPGGDQALKLGKSAAAADKVDALVAA